MTLASEIDRFDELLRTGSQGQIREAIAKVVRDADRMRLALEAIHREAKLCETAHRQVMPKTVFKLANVALGRNEYDDGN